MSTLQRIRWTAGTILILLMAAVLMPVAQAADITCTECGMVLEPGSPFTSRIVAGEKISYFCDIGDLFTYLNKKKPQNVRIEVKDYPSGAWIEAQKAFYVRAEKKFSSPMGWGIAAFRDRPAAAGYGSVMDMKTGLKAVQ